MRAIQVNGSLFFVSTRSGAAAMVAQSRSMTVEEFEKLAALPDNSDKRLELIGGERAEERRVGYEWLITGRIFLKIGNFVEARDLGYLTVHDGGYKVGGARLMPD